MTSAGVQPPDAENRMSGGVEGSRGEIPVTPSDHTDKNMQEEAGSQRRPFFLFIPLFAGIRVDSRFVFLRVALRTRAKRV